MGDPLKGMQAELKNMKKTVSKAVDATGVKKVVETATKPLEDQYKKIEPAVKDLLKFRQDVKKKVFGDVEGQLRDLAARQAVLEANVKALQAQIAAMKKAKK